MKRILKIAAIAITVMLLSTVRNTASAQFSAGISYQTFYDDLSPYGRWIDYPEYGYVWSPDQGSDFRPYSTGGHWEWSDEYEWTWVSDYDWGWATFHYGRWLYDPFYGWLWVPGYEWAPAWVVWRSGGDYCGWAPLRPGVSIGIDFSIGLYSPPIDYWCFAPRQYITSPRIYDYCLSSRQNFSIINNTTIINNYNYGGRGGRNVFETGPRRNDVEGWTHERLRSVSFRDASRPGRSEIRNNEVSIYRPNVQRDDNRRFAPNNFDRYNNRQDNNAYRNRGNDNVNNRSNNLPERREQNNNSSFDRRNNDVTRQDNNNRQVPNNNNTVFDRNRNNNQSNNDNQRRVNPYERRDNTSPIENRNFDRGNNGNQNRYPPQMERQQPQQPPRQFERQQQQQQPSRQMERQQPQQQPRQFENRGNSNNRSQGNNDNRERGNNGNNGNGRDHGRHG